MAVTPKLLKKTTSEVEIFTVNFANRLSGGETITAFNSVTISPVTVPALVDADFTNDTSTVQFQLSGGLIDTQYSLIVQVTTSVGAQNKEEVCGILVEEDI